MKRIEDSSASLLPSILDPQSSVLSLLTPRSQRQLASLAPEHVTARTGEECTNHRVECQRVEDRNAMHRATPLKYRKHWEQRRHHIIQDSNDLDDRDEERQPQPET